MFTYQIEIEKRGRRTRRRRKKKKKKECRKLYSLIWNRVRIWWTRCHIPTTKNSQLQPQDYVVEIYPFIFAVLIYQKIPEKGICGRYGHGHYINSILLKSQKFTWKKIRDRHFINISWNINKIRRSAGIEVYQ